MRVVFADFAIALDTTISDSNIWHSLQNAEYMLSSRMSDVLCNLSRRRCRPTLSTCLAQPRRRCVSTSGDAVRRRWRPRSAIGFMEPTAMAVPIPSVGYQTADEPELTQLTEMDSGSICWRQITGLSRSLVVRPLLARLLYLPSLSTIKAVCLNVVIAILSAVTNFTRMLCVVTVADLCRRVSALCKCASGCGVRTAAYRSCTTADGVLNRLARVLSGMEFTGEAGRKRNRKAIAPRRYVWRATVQVPY